MRPRLGYLVEGGVGAGQLSIPHDSHIPTTAGTYTDTSTSTPDLFMLQVPSLPADAFLTNDSNARLILVVL